MFLVTKIPGLNLQSEFGDYFLPLVVAVFVASVLIAVLAPFDWMLGLILIGSIVVPLSEVTATGAYNVVTTGLLFGALFRIRPNQLRLNRNHAKLFTALLVLGLYYNAIPLLFDDGSGFHPRLWFFNFSTFLKYIFIGLLVTQSRMSLGWVLAVLNWFALVYAAFVLLEAFHIPAVNLGMKMFTFFGQRPHEFVELYALDYFRAAGLAFDPNHAGIRLALLLVIALHQHRQFRLNTILIPMILVAVFLTGSRAGAGLAVVALLVWLVYNYRSFSYQWRRLAMYLAAASFVLLIGLFNPSFSKVAHVATNRYEAVFTSDGYQVDKALSFRSKEILNIDLTPFGDRTDDLKEIHSQAARTMRFYGVFGVLFSVVFWAYYARLVRFTYLGVGLVAVLALTGFAKWTFHIEGFVILVVFITTLLLQSRSNETGTLQPER